VALQVSGQQEPSRFGVATQSPSILHDWLVVGVMLSWGEYSPLLATELLELQLALPITRKASVVR
jgi:hypothetical protein